MKKIGSGWQYSVYDIGNGRVLKKFHSLSKRYLVIFKSIFPFKHHSPFVIPFFVSSMRKAALNSFENLKAFNLEKSMIGNPNFINELDFEQDKVIPLEEYFKGLDMAEGELLIRKFVDFNKKILSMGVIEKNFNLGKNFGIDKSGNIIIIDLGELFYGEEKIRKQILLRPWSKWYVTKNIPTKFVEIFIKEMDRNFL